MANPFFAEVYGVFAGTVGLDVTAGDPMYFDGTNWVLADSTDNTKFAEAFVVESFKSGERGILCTGGILVDTDAPYTQGVNQYLSTTATTITATTETRPTGALNLMQILGFAVDTSTLKLFTPPLHEVTVNCSPMPDPDSIFSQNLDYTGVLLTAVTQAVGYTFMVPQNMVENVIEYLWFTNGAGAPALDSTNTYTIDVSAGINSDTNTVGGDGIASTAMTLTDNDVARQDVSAAFTSNLNPGRIVGIDVEKDAETTAHDPLMLSFAVVLRCV